MHLEAVGDEKNIFQGICKVGPVVNRVSCHGLTEENMTCKCKFRELALELSLIPGQELEWIIKVINDPSVLSIIPNPTAKYSQG